MTTFSIKKILAAITATIVTAAAIYWHKTDGLKYAFAAEALFNDWNFRDFGQSVNDCLGPQSEWQLAQGRLFRSAQWFSGWSCESVGNPDEIISLNFNESTGTKFYCRQPSGSKLTGETYNQQTTLNRIDLLENWQDPAFRSSICRTFSAAFQDIGTDVKFLVHCEAGRDRTGAFMALLAAASWEASNGRIPPRLVEALECDYEKSKSLVRLKYGRIRNFIQTLQNSGGALQFIQQQCSLPSDPIRRAGERLFQKSL